MRTNPGSASAMQFICPSFLPLLLRSPVFGIRFPEHPRLFWKTKTEDGDHRFSLSPPPPLSPSLPLLPRACTCAHVGHEREYVHVHKKRERERGSPVAKFLFPNRFIYGACISLWRSIEKKLGQKMLGRAWYRTPRLPFHCAVLYQCRHKQGVA